MSERYYLFAGEAYYPKGGADDYIAEDGSLGTLRRRLLAWIAEQISEDGSFGCSGVWAHICDDDLHVICRYKAEKSDAPGQWIVDQDCLELMIQEAAALNWMENEMEWADVG